MICPRPDQCSEEAKRTHNPNSEGYHFVQPNDNSGVCYAVPRRIRGNKIVNGAYPGITLWGVRPEPRPPAKAVLCDWIGHKFRARYDLTFPANIRVGAYLISTMGTEPFADKTYRRDVCERCGKVIELERKL